MNPENHVDNVLRLALKQQCESSSLDPLGNANSPAPKLFPLLGSHLLGLRRRSGRLFLHTEVEPASSATIASERLEHVREGQPALIKRALLGQLVELCFCRKARGSGWARCSRTKRKLCDANPISIGLFTIMEDNQVFGCLLFRFPQLIGLFPI